MNGNGDCARDAPSAGPVDQPGLVSVGGSPADRLAESLRIPLGARLVKVKVAVVGGGELGEGDGDCGGCAGGNGRGRGGGGDGEGGGGVGGGGPGGGGDGDVGEGLGGGGVGGDGGASGGKPTMLVPAVSFQPLSSAFARVAFVKSMIEEA